MKAFALFFLLGTLIIQFFQQLPSLIWIGLFLGISIFLTTIFYKKSLAVTFSSLLISISALFAGLLLSTSVAKNQLDKRIPQKWEGKDIILQGKVQGIPNQKEDGTRFRFKINQAALKTAPEISINLKGIVRLGWFRNARAEKAQTQNTQTINADETWQLVVRMKRPSGFLNPGGFDYEKWLFTERISATGYVRGSKEKPENNKRISEAPWWSVDYLRQTIHHKIQEGVEDKSSAAILSALVVAIRTKFDDEQWKQLQQTGTSHLVAISGLHIAVVAGFAFLPIMLIWGLFPRLNEKVPLQVAGAIAGVFFATAYAMLAGFTLPTQRALLMVVIALLGLLVRRHYQSSTILAVVVIAVLLLDPLAGMTVSFWLSFLAVAIILIVLKRQVEKPVMRLIKLQIILSLGMLPLTLFFFGSASLLSPVANLIAIPWVSLVVVPLSLLALVFMPVSSFISNALFSMSALAIKWMFVGFELLADSPLANLTFAEIPSTYLMIAFAGFLFLLLPKGFPARWLGFVAILPALLFTPEKPKQGEFTFTLLDAGQGMASVVQTANHNLIYDVGTRYSETYDIGKLVVVPFLKAKGITTVDSMILSHKDIDHWGGAEAVLDEIKVSKIISSHGEILKNKVIWACSKGDSWQWDGVDFEFLSPSKEFLNASKKDNNHSCVLRVSNANHSLLLTGDIEKKAEKFLLKNAKDKLSSEVISVPHHGSKTSSTKPFLEATSPKLALIPTGYRNRFGHPKEKVLKRYQKMEIPVMDTINSGAITIDFPRTDEKYQLTGYRKRKRGFWSR